MRLKTTPFIANELQPKHKNLPEGEQPRRKIEQVEKMGPTMIRGPHHG